ncbi:class I SAM-dependent methyltransferase [Arthrobacter psychrolactophilus]
MTEEQVRRAYVSRAAEYTARLGSIADMHELDLQRISAWAEPISGPILDAGCGPGQWTDFLHRHGAEISGIDLVPEFVETARLRFPDVSFAKGSLQALEVADGSLQGILAWYSLIHFSPEELPSILAELARVLAPQGRLLVGFFDGKAGESFSHAVTTAYFHSVAEMSGLLRDAGFDVFDVETRQDPGSRPHAALSAIRR